MKKIVFALVVLFLASQAAYAVETSCDAKAAEKKLAGAAKNSFIKNVTKMPKYLLLKRIARLKRLRKSCTEQRKIASPRNASLMQVSKIGIIRR